jgi:hypothetical protein
MPVRQRHFSVRGTDLTVRNGVQNCNGGGFGSRPKMLKKSILSRHQLSCRLLPSYILAECLWHSFTTFHGDRHILNKLVLWGIPTILTTLNLRQLHLPVLLILTYDRHSGGQQGLLPDLATKPRGRRHAGWRCDDCYGQFMVAQSSHLSSCRDGCKIAAPGGGSAIARRPTALIPRGGACIRTCAISACHQAAQKEKGTPQGCPLSFQPPKPLRPLAALPPRGTGGNPYHPTAHPA